MLGKCILMISRGFLVHLISAEPTRVEFSKDVCRSMVEMFDYDRSGKLGLDEFKKLMFEIAKWKVNLDIFVAIIFLNLMNFPFPGCI